MSHFGPSGYDFKFSSPDSLTKPGLPAPRYWPLSPFLLRYAIAKTANALFAKELQRRLDADGTPILSISLHPGGVGTEGARAVFFSFVFPLVKMLMMSPDQGCITQLWAATAKEVRQHEETYKGRYLVPYGKVGKPLALVDDPQVGRDLWQTTQTEINRVLKASSLGRLSM